MPLVREIAVLLGAEYEGDAALMIHAAAALDSAGPAEISFAANRKALKEASSSQAGCLVVPLDFDNSARRTIIRAKDPRLAFARAIELLHPAPRPAAGVHPTASIAPGVVMGDGVSVGPFAVIGSGCVIGDGAVIGAHCVLGANVVLGRSCLLHARVTFYSEVRTGDRCIFHSGTVIGADGFGMILNAGRYEKFPQIGRVEIGDDVEVGANSTIDRGALGATVVGNGVKLDNMVHIGHNCRIGNHVVMAAQTGLGGGSVIEDYVVLGGQVGIADNVTVKARAVVGAKTGVPSGKVLPGDGAVYWGIPGRPIKEYLEGLAHIGKIAKLREEVEQLKKRS